MPIYIYRCENCGVQFERQQKFSDPPLTICPECEKNALRKVYQPVGIVFKGSGFYSTDHRSPSGMSREKGASKGEESKSEESTSKESESSTKKTEDSGKTSTEKSETKKSD